MGFLEAMDFLNKHTDDYDDSMDKIEEFEENNKVTKCEDSTRNTGTHLAWHKENHATRTRMQIFFLLENQCK